MAQNAYRRRLSGAWGSYFVVARCGGVEPNAGTVCAATGALDVRRDRVLCRQVGHLEAKLEGLEKAGVDILFCSAQGDAPVKSYRSVLVKQVSAITQRSNNPYFRMEFA